MLGLKQLFKFGSGIYVGIYRGTEKMLKLCCSIAEIEYLNHTLNLIGYILHKTFKNSQI